MSGRVRNRFLRERVLTAERAAEVVQSGWTIATTGTTSGGHPGAFFRALERRAAAGRLGGLTLWSVAPLGDPVDGALARAGALRRRLGMQANRDLTRAINEGEVLYADWGVHAFTRKARQGAFGSLDLAALEVAEIAEDGSFVPSLCVGEAPTLAALADRVVLEVNRWIPEAIESLHDVPVGRPDVPPAIGHPGDRVGVARVPLDLGKVIGVVESWEEPAAPAVAAPTELQRTIAAHLTDFLATESREQRLSRPVPVQIGLGGLGEAVLDHLVDRGDPPIVLHSPLLGDAALKHVLGGRIACASGTGLFLSKQGLELLVENLESLKEKMVLRPVDVTARPDVIGRLSCVAINTALEVDVYGHVNSSHLPGGRLVSGVGGSVEFARNAALSIFLTPSAAKGGRISTIVPRVCHCDHTEHEVDVVVTENGVADLRGTDPRERARLIVDRCAHPDYRPLLRSWLAETRPGHEPQLEEGEHSFHVRYLDTGSMRRR